LQSAAPFLRIGTRGSPLALAQANLVRSKLAAAHRVDEGDIAVTIITTSGDRLKDVPLNTEGGKGLFTKEIEAALLAGEIDLGVHSTKDVATVLPDGLILAAFLEREDVRDAFVSLTATSLDDLPQGARFGTSSIRRAAQVKRHRPDLQIVPFRGNVDTRLEKLRNGVADATLLAIAGLNRLGRASEATQLLDPMQFPPAPAQGAIGIEIRSRDDRTREAVAMLNHPRTETAITAERALLATLNGSCRTPIGAFSSVDEVSCSLYAQILNLDGSLTYSLKVSGPVNRPQDIGTELGQKLRDLAGPDFSTLFEF
jgi:hydroxymethylbilane synthase